MGGAHRKKYRTQQYSISLVTLFGIIQKFPIQFVCKTVQGPLTHSLPPWDPQSRKIIILIIKVTWVVIKLVVLIMVKQKINVTSHSKWVMHLLQVHLKWANVWLLVVSAVIVAVSTVVAHFLQVVPCSTSATVSQIVKLTAKGFSHKEKHRFGCSTVKNFQRLRMKRDSLYHIQQQILIPPVKFKD